MVPGCSYESSLLLSRPVEVMQLETSLLWEEVLYEEVLCVGRGNISKKKVMIRFSKQRISSF